MRPANWYVDISLNWGIKEKRMGIGRQSWVYQTKRLPFFSGRKRIYFTRVNINFWWPSSLNNDPTKLNYKFTIIDKLSMVIQSMVFLS